MDRDNANFEKAMNSIKEISSINVVPVQLPWGEKENFKGVIDLLTMKAYAGDGAKAEDIPAEYKDAAEEAQMELIETAAEGRRHIDGKIF